MKDFIGDYMGFTYNGIHSSALGIVRVSDGSRFVEDLLPAMQDKTVPVPGGDGTYYFGSYYTQKIFKVSFAFDSLTEEQLQNLKRHFSDKKIHDLIFDETPYKVYSAKVTGIATLKYIPFAEGVTNRIYKGEGNIQFTCFEPFARCRYKTLEECQENSNWEEWILASRIAYLDENGEYVESAGNFGDMPISFKLTISGSGSITIGDQTIKWGLPSGILAQLDTKKGLVLEIKDDVLTNEILNEYVIGDLTLKIPVGEQGPNNADFTCLYV